MATTASTGTLFAAALETSGYKAQSMVLEQLGSMLHHLGAIFYIICFISAFLALVVTGKYRTGLWLLVGPPLFLFLLKSTVIAHGADWQFGAFRDDSNRRVEQVLNETVNAKVSGVFHWYNTLVSSVVQNLIIVLNDSNLRDKMVFMTRQRILEHMFNADIGNADLLALVHHGLQGECHQEMNAARTLALGRRDPKFKGTSEWNDAMSYYTANYGKANKAVPANSPMYNAISNILTTNREAGTADAFIDRFCDGSAVLKQNFREANVDNVLSRGVSCQQIWCWSGMGVQQEARNIQARVEETFVSKEAREQHPEIVQEIWEDIMVKMSPPVEFPGAEPVQPDISLIPTIIGGVLLRKELTKDPRSRMYSELGKNSGYKVTPYNFNLQMTEDQLQETLRRGNQHTQATALRYQAFTFAMALPYFQGVFLYALALTFPFFCLLVLLPGKATSFFMWMAGWFWVKSWDVGWAVVMVADEILWSMMPHSSVYDPLGDPNHGPITILDSAFSADPAYSLSTYYMVLVVMLTAVPMVTAQMIIGSKKAVGGIFINGISQMGQVLGGSAADAVNHKLVADVGRMREFGRLDFIRRMQQGRDGISPGAINAHRRIAGVFDEGAEERSSGSKWMVGGAVAGLSAAFLARNPLVASRVLSGVAAGAAGAGAVGAGYGYTQRDGGVQKQRHAAGAYASLMNLQSLEHEYRYNYSQEFKNLEMLRAGWSTRGEFWNETQAPTDIYERMITTLNALEANKILEENRATGRVVGEAAKRIGVR